ncbi:MAG: LytTR family DNA-binding domain-containing protein [Caryophanon sp.]|nr:LytTR family DNA-binding domain-containing protein [Caryophanon sp.]
MSIFILEDDVMQAQRMRTIVEELCAAQQIPYNFIKVTSKPDDILANIARCTYIPIYFLDIEIKHDERKGLDVARLIRNVDSLGIIVFVTTHCELAPISYQYMVSALAFIDKNAPTDAQLETLQACLNHYVERNQIDINEDFLLIDNAYTTIKVPFADVEYVMTDEPHRLQLVTDEQLIQFYGTLKEVEQLEPRLVRCHKSVLVNPQKMTAIDTKQQQIMLRSGKCIPVSRRLMKHMKALFNGGNI